MEKLKIKEITQRKYLLEVPERFKRNDLIPSVFKVVLRDGERQMS